MYVNDFQTVKPIKVRIVELVLDNLTILNYFSILNYLTLFNYLTILNQ